MRWIWITLFGVISLGCQHKNLDDSQVLGGVTADNGGDIVFCRPDPALRDAGGTYFEGPLSLDYILTFDPNPAPGDVIVTQDSWSHADHTSRIQRLLDEKFPRLGEEFRGYIAELESSDPAGRRVWQRSSVPLVDFHDEQFIQSLPDNCYVGTGDNRTLDIQQMVLRRRLVSSRDKVVYVYDHERFRNLERNAPLQLSFLIVHEWLWDLTDSPWANRTFNKILHSRHFDTMTSEDLERLLADFGVVFTDEGNLVAAAEQDGVLQNVFTGNRFCDWDFKIVKEFQPQTNILALEPGESKRLNMRLQPNDDVLGDKICGFSVMVPVQSGNGSQIDVRLARGPLPAEYRVVNETSDPMYDLRYALCNDRGCLRTRSGDEQLRRLLPRGIPTGEWVMTLNNTGNSRTIIRRPYMTFVSMKRR